ncbi:MAG: hypothetical protein IJZ04_06655 [Clostridia bacterium]|nr:hypothetical protein [Clostridia bacterium]
MKKLSLIALSIILLLSVCSCNDETETSEYSEQSYTTYYATLICPEDEGVNGRVIDVYWRKGYHFPIPVREAYSFVGWQYGDDILSSVDIWRYAKSAELTAIWEPTVYEINYEMSPHFSQAVSTYTVESEDFTLPIPNHVKDHMFLGWKRAGSDEIKKVITVPKGSYGSIDLVASWVSADDIECQKDGFAIEIVDDYAVVVGYFGEWKNELYIPNEYNGYPVKALGEGALYEFDWYISKNEYTILNIPASIERIEDYALGGWSGAPMKIYDGEYENWRKTVSVGVGNGSLSEQ